jgi:hypothetical protein
MLYFPPDFPYKVYIGICDWTMVRNLNDLKESFYIHETQEAKTRIMPPRWWVALELNYILPPPRSTRNVDVERQSKYTKKRLRHLRWTKLLKAIYSDNLSLAFYTRYIKEKRADDVYNYSSMN